MITDKTWALRRNLSVRCAAGASAPNLCATSVEYYAHAAMQLMHFGERCAIFIAPAGQYFFADTAAGCTLLEAMGYSGSAALFLWHSWDRCGILTELKFSAALSFSRNSCELCLVALRKSGGLHPTVGSNAWSCPFRSRQRSQTPIFRQARSISAHRQRRGCRTERRAFYRRL